MSCSLPRLDLESSFKHSHGRLLSERRDSTHSGSYVYGGAHAHAKHGMTVHQQVIFNSSAAEERDRGLEGKTRSDSLSVSLDGGALHSDQGVTRSAPCSTVASPQRLTLQPEVKKDGEDDDDDDDDEGGGSTSTLVSFPLTFSDTLESADSSMQDFSPRLLHRDGNDSSDGVAGVGGALSGGVLGHKMKMQSLSADTVKSVLAVGRATPIKRDKGECSVLSWEVILCCYICVGNCSTLCPFCVHLSRKSHSRCKTNYEYSQYNVDPLGFRFIKHLFPFWIFRNSASIM